ncbi:MAG: putative hydro-lyase [Pseudomonadota bacterium]
MSAALDISPKTHANLIGADVGAVRAAIRSGAYQGHTAGLAPGKLQANLAILTGDYAADFERFCRLNPQPCPLVGMTAPGDPHWRALGDIDIRTDVPSYNIYRNGELAGRATDIRDLWTDDMVAFALGCSFTFEKALVEAGVPMAHIEADATVPMFRTNIETTNAGPFGGGMVVSMRHVAEDQVDLARETTARFPWAHGAPVHVGDPAEIGIADVMRPDWGDPPVHQNGVPMFWACGVTPQNALTAARPPLCITHTPGRMLVCDLADDADSFIQ